MNNDTENAIKILKDNKIAECCQWLLSGNENLYNALRSVQGVEMLTGMHDDVRCFFDYDGTPYKITITRRKLVYQQGDPVVNIRIGENRDNLVLEAGVDIGPPIRINLDNVHRVNVHHVEFGDWVENISKIVQEAQQTEKRQQQ